MRLGFQSLKVESIGGYVVPSESMDAETLAELDLALERILAEFKRVCGELGLPYFVYGGTAIGAVRHNGFRTHGLTLTIPTCSQS